ncbi:MAG TPA: TetR/AcrR family transcriptional regulator [Trebonia sp.]|jgi:AcrR family transcriptional regulator|nr:TetR/AcrR family transcriptional regulator [Trebonia sp.]
MTETYQRARRPEQKLERRDAILAAAGELALRDGVRAVSLADIAVRVGIHKSALLRYFETREQIFLELTAQAWQEWTAELRSALGPPHPVSTDPVTTDPDSIDPGILDPGILDPERIALVAGVFAGSFGSRPLLCDLIAHTPLNLERNVSAEAVRRYKLTSLGAVREAAALVQRVLPALTVPECLEFVAAVASLAGALWQIANPVPVLAELYATDPALAGACVDLTPRLRRTGEIMLAGLIPSRAV